MAAEVPSMGWLIEAVMSALPWQISLAITGFAVAAIAILMIMVTV